MIDQPAERGQDEPLAPETNLNPFASPAVSSQALGYTRRKSLDISLVLWAVLAVPGVLWTLLFISLFVFAATQAFGEGFRFEHLFGLGCIAMLGLPGVLPVWMLFRKLVPSRHDKLLERYRK